MEFIDRYILELQHKNPATLSQLRRISAYFGTDQVVTAIQVMDFVINRRTSGAAPATINRELTILKQLFKWALIRGYVKEDPTVSIKSESGVAKRIRYITIDEEQQLIQNSAVWLQPIIQFATSTGMRRGEIINLLKNDIDLNNQTAIIRTSKNGEPRVIPLTRRALDAVAKAMSIHGKVFGGKNGEWLRESNLEYNFKAAARKAKIEDLHFHDLRHTFATRLIQAGVELYMVQKLLGHKNPVMTQRYCHLSVDSLRKAIDLLN